MAPRVGLVGCGLWGRHILRDLRALGCEVPVVARSDASVGRAREGGASSVVASIPELGSVDGVVIATPEVAHAAHVREALELGSPVFCEKPLTVDPASAAELARLAPDSLFVMDKWRYHPGTEALRDLAASGELGEPMGLRTVRLGWGSAHETSDSSWHLLPHDLSIALEVLGRVPEPVAASAEVVNGKVHGLVGLLGRSPWLAVEVSSASPERRREVHLACEGGIAWLPGPDAPAVGVAKEPGVEPEWRQIGDGMPLLAELRAFVEHLGGGPPPRSSAAEGAANVATVGRLRELAGLPAASPETAP